MLPLKVLAEQSVIHRIAQDLDFRFLKCIACVPKTPEYGGFNTKLAREQSHRLKPATTVMYTPFIDMVPSDPDTIMTAMYEAQRLTVKCGQTFTIFTADQQLYRVMVSCFLISFLIWETCTCLNELCWLYRCIDGKHWSRGGIESCIWWGSLHADWLTGDW